MFFESVFINTVGRLIFFLNNFEEIAEFKIRGSVTCLHILKWYAKPCTQVKIQDSLIDFEGNFFSAMRLKNSPVHKIKTKKKVIMDVSLILGFKGRKMRSGSKAEIFSSLL